MSPLKAKVESSMAGTEIVQLHEFGLKSCSFTQDAHTMDMSRHVVSCDNMLPFCLSSSVYMPHVYA